MTTPSTDPETLRARAAEMPIKSFFDELSPLVTGPDVEEKAISRPCPTCRAKVGERCHLAFDGANIWVHEARWPEHGKAKS